MKKSLILLCVTLVAVAYVWWREVRPESKVQSTDEAMQASKTLTGLKKEQIKGFTIQQAGGEAIAVEKAGDAWQLAAPVKASADEGNVNSVVWDLEGVEKEGMIEPKDLTPEKLTSYGLDKPKGTIDVVKAGSAGKTEALHFIVGGSDVEGSMIYVRAGNDGPVYIVAKRFAENLSKTAFDLRDKSLITLVPTQIGSLRLFGPTKVFVQKDGNLWDLKEPFEDYADPATVQEALKDAVALSVVSFVSEDAASLPQYGLDNPERYITVTEGASGKSTTVNFGKDAPEQNGEKLVYASLGGGHTVFTLKADAVSKLFVAQDAIQSKSLTRLDPYMLKGVTYTYGQDQVELSRPDYDWKIAKPYGAEASNDAVIKFLETFQNAKINQFLADKSDDKKYGFDAPRGSFSYTLADKAPAGLVFGADAGDGFVYVKRTDTPGVYKVSGTLLNALKTPTVQLHTLDMLKVNFTHVTGITLQREDRTYTVTHEGEAYSGTWKLTAPVATNANSRMFTDLATSLSVTRAVEIVEEKATDLAKYGLDKPALKVSFSVKPGNTAPRPLLVGKVCEAGKRYAMVEGDSVVFTINSGFARSLFDEARDPSIFSFKVGDATEVEFKRGDARYVIKKGEGGWMLQVPESSEVDQQAVTSELAHLATLETTKFVDFTTAKLKDYGLDNPQAVVRIVMPSGVEALSVGNMAESGLYYATSTTVDGIFLLTPGDLSKVLAPEKVARSQAAPEAAPVASQPEGEAERTQAAELESTAEGAAPVQVIPMPAGAEAEPQSGSELPGGTGTE